MDKFIWDREKETKKEFICRMCTYHDEDGISWPKIAEYINGETGDDKTCDSYRKAYTYGKYEKYMPNNDKNTESFEEKIELMKEKVKISDERRQLNAYVRQLSREETLKEIAIEIADKMSEKKMLPKIERERYHGKNEAILQLSDVHYGAVVDNYWNKYSPEIAKDCFAKLLKETREKCIKNDVKTIHVVNLGDLINGYIHMGVRLSNRIDIITQTIEISEILAEFLYDLSKDFKLHFYSCLDNHSRLDPNKQDSLDLESLGRIIPWYLKERIGDVVSFHENEYDYDIINFECMGYKVIGVHGHKEKINTVVEKLSMLTHEYYDLVLTAHLHHFSCDEQNETIVVSNGAMLGTDTFAKNLRLSSKPSQNLIIVSKDSVIDCIYRLILR